MEAFQVIAGVCSIVCLVIALVTLIRVVRLEKLYTIHQNLSAKEIKRSQVTQTAQNK